MDPRKTKVILVANSKYPNWGSGNKNIDNAAVNLERLEKIIHDDQYFGIKDEKQLVTIRDKSSQEVLLRIKRETEKCEDRGMFERLIFYYCGHGIPGEDGILFFATNDTIRDDYELTAINSRQLYRYLKKFGARELIVLIDCCYAAQSAGNAGDEETLIEKNLPKSVISKSPNETEDSGVYYLFASGKDNVAKFNPNDNNIPTYFTEALINAIYSGTDPTKEFVRVAELEDNLENEIKKLKAKYNPDIPLPYPVREGITDTFEFCKNKKKQNQEDIEWHNTLQNVSRNSISQFIQKYPDSKYADEAFEIIDKIKSAISEYTAADKTQDSKTMKAIKQKYADIHEVVRWCKDWLVVDMKKTSAFSPSLNFEVPNEAQATTEKATREELQAGRPEAASSRMATELKPENKRNAKLNENND